MFDSKAVKGWRRRWRSRSECQGILPPPPPKFSTFNQRDLKNALILLLLLWLPKRYQNAAPLFPEAYLAFNSSIQATGNLKFFPFPLTGIFFFLVLFWNWLYFLFFIFWIGFYWVYEKFRGWQDNMFFFINFFSALWFWTPISYFY